ncbi:hypothetical protein LUZ60_013840 [Juncus effusus]|nr:hypothetical protein LUZ60_013840 [Juncus effusus]
MPESSSDPNGSKQNHPKRNLPSWMSSKESIKKTKSDDEPTGASSSHNSGNKTTDFSKLLDGVVFVLSGFVNPERGNLRTQIMEMGAEYKPDWNPNCTLLVCAFANTPKFRQVQSDNGTIVSKEWILECYEKKKLVPIEPYLLHAGKPWRKQNKDKNEIMQDEKKSPKKEPQKKIEKPHAKSIPSMGKDVDSIDSIFSVSKVKIWAKNDLTRTISWLQNQEEKPEENKIKEIAAEGILTCMQDAIESLQQNHGVNEVTEQWEIVPRAVKEITEQKSLKKEKVLELFVKCKRIYEGEFGNSDISMKEKKKTANEEYDSDETIEMTEEEIERACANIL